MRGDRGFTFLELLVVTLVIGISLAIAIPAMNNALDRNKVFTSSELVAAQIREARLAAITRNSTFRVRFDCFGGTAVRMVIVTGNPTVDNASDRCTQQVPNDGPPIYLPPNVSFGAGGPPPALEINGRGQVSAVAGTMPQTLSVSYGDFTRTLVVTEAGRVRTPTS
ncbi:MAG: prepilin-type N-terminal cleavage/methylation domain-containing protein [Acidobacteria bacterium]|nr:prepilin-type N-terminal cleavage/methylation domain-containing protein [Acidobacteriota bacterium]